MQATPKVNDVTLFDGRPVKVVAVDGHAVAFVRKRLRKPRKTDLPGDPIQIVNLTTWIMRTWNNSFNTATKPTAAYSKSRKRLQVASHGAAQPTQP